MAKALIFLLVLSGLSRATEHRFGGGMGAYFQYADIQSDYGQLKGLAWGLGGRLHFNLGKHFRVGGLGSTWHLSYQAPGLKGSYYDLGYGGLTAELVCHISSARIGLGVLAGGGAATNLHVVSQNASDRISAIYTHSPTIIFAPMLTCEYPLTKVISVMATLDFLMGNHLGTNQRLGSPGLRVGMLFNR